MAAYRIDFKPGAEKELAAVPLQLAGKIKLAIDALAINPYPPGCKKLRGMAGL